MHKQGFTKIERSEKRMYGPKGLVVCGYSAEEQNDFVTLIDKVGLSETRVIFATTDDLTRNVGDIFSSEKRDGVPSDSSMPRATLMSGLTQNELHSLMAAYRDSGFARQIWATLTPISEKWPLENLLNELQAEDKAMKNKRQK